MLAADAKTRRWSGSGNLECSLHVASVGMTVEFNGATVRRHWLKTVYDVCHSQMTPLTAAPASSLITFHWWIVKRHEALLYQPFVVQQSRAKDAFRAHVYHIVHCTELYQLIMCKKWARRKNARRCKTCTHGDAIINIYIYIQTVLEWICARRRMEIWRLQQWRQDETWQPSCTATLNVLHH